MRSARSRSTPPTAGTPPSSAPTPTSPDRCLPRPDWSALTGDDRPVTPEQKAEYAVADNRTAELASWDPEVLQALFEPFDLNDDDTGVTIGLYLARALTVAHGGTVGVDQDEAGAVLWVRVPLGDTETTRDRVVDGAQGDS